MSITDPSWVPVWITIVTTFGTIVTAGMSVWNNSIARKNRISLKDTHERIGQLEENTNNKMDQLLTAKDDLKVVSDKAEYAKGVIEGNAGR